MAHRHGGVLVGLAMSSLLAGCSEPSPGTQAPTAAIVAEDTTLATEPTTTPVSPISIAPTVPRTVATPPPTVPVMTTPPAQPPSTTTLTPAPTIPVEGPAPIPPEIQLPLPSWAFENATASTVPSFRAPTASALVLVGCARTSPDIHTLVFRVTATGGASWTWPAAFPSSGDTSEQRFEFVGHPAPFVFEVRQFLVRSDDWPIGDDYRSGSLGGRAVAVDLPWSIVAPITCR